jgi:hypothetical protein
MKSHNEIQLAKFMKYKEKYGNYIRINNVCVFRNNKSKAYCVNIESFLIETI